MKRYRFLIYIIIVFVLADVVLTWADPVGTLTLFRKNDFDKIILEHNSNEFDKAFYGNSAVISAYIEGDSSSGYVNCGMDYATVEDLEIILDRDLIKVNSELVIGLNYFTLLDTLETNETYPWHRKIYQPYVYFARDRLSEFIQDNIGSLLENRKVSSVRYDDYSRYIYYGALSYDELCGKIEKYESQYFSQGIEAHNKNLAALQEVINFCDMEGIRLRVVWMPWNPQIEMPDIVIELMEKTNEILNRNDIETYDVTYFFDAMYFHDIGHLNYEDGAPLFTMEVEQWLAKS